MSARVLERIRRELARSIASCVEQKFGAGAPAIVLERPPRIDLGDLACPVAFELARTLRRPPRAIASEVAGGTPPPPGARALSVEGGGYVNAKLEREEFVRALGEDAVASAGPEPGRKTVVEHTNINPNKAAHIGHLRNAALGDVYVRAVRFLGGEVEVQNYLDDTGVQVADVVAALVHMGGIRTETEARATIASAKLPDGRRNPKGFAYLCWDLYAEITREYDANAGSRAWRTEVLHAIEAGDKEIARIAAAVAEAIS